MTRRSRPRRILAWTLGSLGGLVVAGVAGILIWSQVGVMAAEPGPLAAVRADADVRLTDEDAAIVLAPASDESTVGLVFIPGAKVEPVAYAAKLVDLVTAERVTVVITKPTLNLAFFDLRGLDTSTALAPDVETWAVGGHSLGGVRACQLASDADALVLFASYCSNDLSASGLPVLSLAGSEDGLSTPAKIADTRSLLPVDAELVEIAGASHASFGDYGPQAGDGVPQLSDAEMSQVLDNLLGAFFRRL